MNIESNSISTSKYTWYDLFPKILIEQFSKMANIYFLLIAIMQSIQEISISAGRPVILLPLTVVIFINGFKDFIEDWKRKVSDDEENNKDCLIYNKEKNKFEKDTWSNVKIGNIVKIKENEGFPADMVILSSSEPNGVCYIETKSLDGETNLKFRQANSKIYSIIDNNNENTYSSLTGVVLCKSPNENIYEFDARLKFHENSDNFVYIDKTSFLPRGCSLKQTEYVYGLIIYIGHNTKIMKNSPSARSKTSKIENIMNIQIIIIFILQISLSITGSLFHLIWQNKNFNEINSYILLDNKNPFNGIVTFISGIGTWVLIFTNLVPISLLVTMEMVKYIQGIFISWDYKLYDKKQNISARVQTSTLNEELGQVKYIFSDKTGTLTKNYMEFKKMSIGKYVYGDSQNENVYQYKQNKDERGEITNVRFVDRLNIFKQHRFDASHENTEYIELFLQCISLCHSVITDAKELTTGKFAYQASSPDEMSLVNAARYFGSVFKGRDIEGNIFLDVNKTHTEYKLLNLLEYSSERKKMSVIVQCPDNKIRLFIKGADSVLRNKITQNKELLDINEEHMMDFAKEGLRTLLVAYRDVDFEEYAKWNEDFMEIMTDPSKKDRMLNGLFERIEKDLFLIGATAIEDKLQDNVDTTLQNLRDAGINIWMLTGDKMDTAKSIAFSCRLLTYDFNLFEIPEKSKKYEIAIKLETALKTIKDDINREKSKYGLIIGTDELALIFSDNTLETTFYKLTVHCKSVICCRASPKQKSQVVTMIRTYRPQATTLAIGDGANDVNMITTAHIGVGILGVEGHQAARASDYSIGEFSFLQRLLLVHGRESYRKNSLIVCYNFYKNVLFVIPQFWFGIVSLYSGQTLYDPWIYQFFNIFFSSIPIIWFGIYDKEIEYTDLETTPVYYSQGIAGKLFHSIRFWKWVILGIVQGFLIFLFCFYSMSKAESDGMLIDLWSVGSMAYAAVVTTVNMKILISTNSHTIVSVVLFALSIICYWTVLFIMSYYYKFENFHNFFILLSSVSFYLASVLILIATLSLDIGISKISHYFGIVKEGKEIKPEKIDEELKRQIVDTHIIMGEDMKIKYYGEAFSQEKGQNPPIFSKLSL